MTIQIDSWSKRNSPKIGEFLQVCYAIDGNWAKPKDVRIPYEKYLEWVEESGRDGEVAVSEWNNYDEDTRMGTQQIDHTENMEENLAVYIKDFIHDSHS